MSSENNNNNNGNNINSKDFMIGSLIGGLLGASAALLLAPKSGKELRQDLNEQVVVVRDKTNQFREVAVEKGTAFADAAKERTDRLTQTVNEQSSELKDKVKNWKESRENNQADEVEAKKPVVAEEAVPPQAADEALEPAEVAETAATVDEREEAKTK